jgi:hypothetical protein
MPLCADDRCASCGVQWTESTYCPPCQDIIDEIEHEIMACPRCGGRTPDEGQLCPGCEEDACPLCLGVTPDPGAPGPPCQDALDELEACPGCGGATPDPGEYCPGCEDMLAEYRDDA